MTWKQEHKGWTHRDELAARSIEYTDLWGRLTLMALGAKAQKLPPPPQITHPGRQVPPPPRKPTSDPGEIRRFFAQHVRR